MYNHYSSGSLYYMVQVINQVFLLCPLSMHIYIYMYVIIGHNPWRYTIYQTFIMANLGTLTNDDLDLVCREPNQNGSLSNQ